MAFTISSAPALLDLTFGQVREFSVTVDSSSAISTGASIKIVPALYAPTSFAMPFLPASNYFEVAYPAAASTVAMTWVGSTKYQNLVLELERVTNVQFRVHFDFIVGADRFDENQQIDPFILLTSEGNQFSIYRQSRFLNLHIFDTSGIAVATGIPTTARSVRPLFQDSFQTIFRRASGVQVSNPVIGENLTIDFSLAGSSLDLNYDVIIFNEGFCAAQGGVNDSIEDHLDLEGATSLGPAALPSLTNANLVPSAMVLDAGLYKGSFEINQNWLIAGCTQSFIIVVTDGSGNKYSYKNSFIALAEEAPDPDVVVKGALEGDSTIYTTGCFANVPPCMKAIFYAEMDTDDYDTKVAALGLAGNYSENIQAINVYALDFKPVDGQDLSEYESFSARQGPLLPGNVFFEYTFPEDAEGVTFIVFDYVFKEHSLRVPIKILHPVVGPFDALSFEDESSNPINTQCYAYDNGIRVILEVTVPANEYGLAPNVFKIYLNDVEQDIIVPGSINATESQVDFLLDVDKIDPEACYKIVTSRDPLDSALVGPCLPGNFSITQFNLADGQFRLTLAETSGNDYFNPRTVVIVSKAGETIHIEEFTSTNWNGLTEFFIFNNPYANDNSFKYEIFIYPENGCNYYVSQVLTTNDQLADSDNQVIVVTV